MISDVTIMDVVIRSSLYYVVVDEFESKYIWASYHADINNNHTYDYNYKIDLVCIVQ